MAYCSNKTTHFTLCLSYKVSWKSPKRTPDGAKNKSSGDFLGLWTAHHCFLKVFVEDPVYWRKEGETLVWHELRHQETESWAHHHTALQIITYCKIAKSLQNIIRGGTPRVHFVTKSHVTLWRERGENQFWLMTPSRGQGLLSLISICRSLKPSPTTLLS